MMDSKSLNKAPETKKFEAQIAPDQYRHSIVDSKKIPLDALLVHVEGSTWVVDYYSQVLGEDEEINDFSPNMNSPYQQYLKIERYEMKLQGNLSSSFDDEQNRATITGTALTYPKLKPNKGDVIIADVGDGRAGQFTVTSVSQKSMFNNSLYEINFELARFLDHNTEKILNSRVVKVGHFVKDFLTYGQNPVLVTSEFNLLNELENYINDLLGAFLSEFYSHELGTIRVPQCGCGYTFDPFVASLIIRVFTSREHPYIDKIHMYNCDEHTLSSYTDIWDAILSGERYLLEMSFRRYHVVPTSRFLHNHMLRNIKFSRVQSVVLPILEKDSINDPLDVCKFPSGAVLTDTKLTPEMIKEQQDLNIVLPDITKGFYVFSEDVYDITDNKDVGRLEQEVRNYFQVESVNPYTLIDYAIHVRKFTKLQRFYLIPVLLLLMIHCVRKIG